MIDLGVLAQRCKWCNAPAPYNEGTRCQHGSPPRECRIHGSLTDLNLVARGRHAVIKCTHHGQGWVVLWATPIGDDREHGSYVVQFVMVGVGQERYKIEPQKGTCPHAVYDQLVREMRAGARPSVNRIPGIETRIAQPGKELPNDPSV